MIQDYLDSLVIAWNTDDAGQKVSIQITNEEHKIVNNKFTLNQIPDLYNRIQITGYFEIKNNQQITATNQFKCDYTTGQITMHSSKNAQTITVAQYFGRGIIYYPSSRIYTELDNSGNVKETLADIFDKSKVIYKTPVATYANIATTYPSPLIGEAVQVEDNGRFYRWDGSAWQYFQILYPTQLAQILTDMGDKTNLLTTIKTSIVNAINEIVGYVGNLGNLLTTAKDSLVNAINENFNNITNITTQELESNGYGVVSGLTVSAQTINDMTVNVASGVVHMPDGKRFTPIGNNALAINSSDATKPRTDIIYVNISGVVSYLASELGTAAVAGKETYTIYTNAVAGDTVIINGITFTAVASGATGNQFNVGANTSATAINLTNLLNANTTISAKFTATVSTNIITLTEKIAGGGDTPTTATTTGTIVITNGTVVTSTAQIFPTAPATPNEGLLLSEVKVGAGVTTIQSGNITDKRKIKDSLPLHLTKTLTGAVNVKTGYNAVGDGITDDHTALQNAANASSGKVMIIPSGTYYNSSMVTILANTKVIGYNAIIKGEGFACTGDNISFYGIKFKANTGIGTFPENGISATKVSDIFIDNCIFDQTRVVFINDADSDAYGKISITNSEFIGDWSGYTEESNSNLIFSEGFTDLIITGNKFKTTGSNRFLKITSSVYYAGINTGIGISKRVVISNNIFNGTCNKQIMDLYAGTDEIVIDGNVINVTGCTDAIEGKTDGGVGQTNTNGHRNILISNNIVTVSSATILLFQGAYGLTFEGDEQILKIEGNILRSTNATPSTLISVRGFHVLNIDNNDIYCTGENNFLHSIDCRASKTVVIQNNTSNKGSIGFFETSSTTGGLPYNSPLSILIIKGNTLKETRDYGGILVRYLTQGNVTIVDNFLQTSNTSPILASLYITDSIINDLLITGNFGLNDGNSGLNRLYMPVVTINRYTHFNNSWQRKIIESTVAPTTGTWAIGDIVWNTSPLIGNYVGWICVTAGTPGIWQPFGIINLQSSITWDVGSLADGAGETSAAITVTGAALGDFVLVSAPYDLQGITCNGYVSAANTVKIRLQNETGSVIDLASGTWKVKVIKA